MAVRAPLLGPERMNPLIELGAKEYVDSLRLLMQNLAPKGMIVGQEKERDPEERLKALMKVHDRNLSVAFDPKALPGDVVRAQTELFEELDLIKEIGPEVFGNDAQ